MIEHEQANGRGKIAMAAIGVDAGHQIGQGDSRPPAISFRPFQNASSRLTLVLCPAMTIERLTTGDFIGRLLFRSGAVRDRGWLSPGVPLRAFSSLLWLPLDWRLAAASRSSCCRLARLRAVRRLTTQPCRASTVTGYMGVGPRRGPVHRRQLRRYGGGEVRRGVPGGRSIRSHRPPCGIFCRHYQHTVS